MSCLVELEDVHLYYPALVVRRTSLKETVFNLVRRKRRTPLVHDVHALRGVTMRMVDGERVGVIGANGAGKSTLLRAIAGVYPIASGSVKTEGAVQSLFELGLGFEEEATGRENIMYRGLLMGARPVAVATKEKEIVDFAGLGEFIDYPVRTYSSGMLVRLAFAISTSFEAEILLIDEVINAGDAAFIRKARARLEGLVARSRIMIVVTHDLNAVREICNRAIYLDHGVVGFDGSPQEAISTYLASLPAGST